MITILLQRPGQTIARPVGRVTSDTLNSADKRAVHAFISDWMIAKLSDDARLDIAVANIDTDEPLVQVPYKGEGFARFYAFREEA